MIALVILLLTRLLLAEVVFRVANRARALTTPVSDPAT
jgi:hypothetical protein